MATSLAAQLGYAADARLVIFHLDDVGMCHGSNRAMVELSAAGIVKSGSIMAPCSWTTEMLRLYHEYPGMDVGVHLTLTSEFAGYRWGSLTSREPADGLVRADSTFWPTVAEAHAHLSIPAAERELRAQVQLLVEGGVAISHLDSHMGANFAPELLEIYTALGAELGVQVFYPTRWNPNRPSLESATALHEQAVEMIRQRRLPPVDHFSGTPCWSPDAPSAPSADVYERVIGSLAPGITHFALHGNAPGEIEAIDPYSAPWRIFEFHYFQSARLERFLATEGIIPIAYRDLQAVMRAPASPHPTL
jgi:chitin disaccharide deacetylase